MITRFYDLPPFFTLQRAPATRQRQLGLWADVVLQEAIHRSLTSGKPLFAQQTPSATSSSQLTEAAQSSSSSSSSSALVIRVTDPVFVNASIKRKLDSAAISEVFAFMVQEGRAVLPLEVDQEDGGGSTPGQPYAKEGSSSSSSLDSRKLDAVLVLIRPIAEEAIFFLDAVKDAGLQASLATIYQLETDVKLGNVNIAAALGRVASEPSLLNVVGISGAKATGTGMNAAESTNTSCIVPHPGKTAELGGVGMCRDMLVVVLKYLEKVGKATLVYHAGGKGLRGVKFA